MAKDRLSELQRQSSNNNEIHINVNTGDSSENSNKIRNTFERAKVVGSWLEEVEKNVQEARVFIKRIEDIKYNQKDVQDRLQSLFHQNTSIAQKISPKLKEFAEELGKIKEESAEGRIVKIQYNTLQTRFQKAFLENCNELENYRMVQKQNIRAQLNAKNVRVTDEELTSLLDEGGDLHMFTEQILSETAEARRLLANIEERHQQLLQIERMLVEVRDLFAHMSILVDNQQELVDRIEYQAQAATNYIASVDLEKVRKSKRKHLRRKIYLAIALIILLAIILILLFKS